jgi:hypothetical protein
VRGRPFSLSLPQGGDFSLRSKRQGDAGMPRYRSARQGRDVTPSLFCPPNPFFIVTPNEVRGSHLFDVANFIFPIYNS